MPIRGIPNCEFGWGLPEDVAITIRLVLHEARRIPKSAKPRIYGFRFEILKRHIADYIVPCFTAKSEDQELYVAAPSQSASSARNSLHVDTYGYH